MWEAAAGRDNRERYYNIGWAHDFNPNTSFKVLYQYIDYTAGNFGGGGIVQPDFDYTGGVAVTQFTVRF